MLVAATQCRQLRTIAPKKFYMNLRLSSQFSLKNGIINKPTGKVDFGNV